MNLISFHSLSIFNRSSSPRFFLTSWCVALVLIHDGSERVYVCFFSCCHTKFLCHTFSLSTRAEANDDKQQQQTCTKAHNMLVMRLLNDNHTLHGIMLHHLHGWMKKSARDCKSFCCALRPDSILVHFNYHETADERKREWGTWSEIFWRTRTPQMMNENMQTSCFYEKIKKKLSSSPW